jgi:signal transduction histidine kinase
MTTVVREALDLVRVQARHGDIEIVDALQDDSGLVCGDPHLLMQALLNIFINALQAMPEGGRLHVASGKSEGGQCLLRIGDTGGGMPQEILRQIFDPFFTTKPEGQGTGLGLTIAHRIVEMHDGVMRVESTPGSGTAFEIELPTGCDDG